MRLFAAVEIPDAARTELKQRCEPLLPGVSGLRVSDPVTWHVTLAFFGDVADSRVDRLVERLRRAATRSAPLALALAGAGRFDGRVLWVGVDGDVEHLSRLAASVAAAGRREGINVEHRRYRPHVTLARSSVPVDLGPVVDELATWRGSAWTVDRLTLFRSDLGPPVRHTAVEAWPLGRGLA
ncbi:MAG: RNA 2',3'-cyclic phosphodiesterase [Actinomycetes bacterium]